MQSGCARRTISCAPRRLQAMLSPRSRSVCVAVKKESATGLKRSGLSFPRYGGLDPQTVRSSLAEGEGEMTRGRPR
jgi:hypothetical protein